jgi:hypothetical protein
MSHVSVWHGIEAPWNDVLTRLLATVACPTQLFHVNCASTQILQRRWTSSSTHPQVPYRQKNILRPPTLGAKSPSLAVSEVRPMGVAEYAV